MFGSPPRPSPDSCLLRALRALRGEYSRAFASICGCPPLAWPVLSIEGPVLSLEGPVLRVLRDFVVKACSRRRLDPIAVPDTYLLALYRLWIVLSIISRLAIRGMLKI